MCNPCNIKVHYTAQAKLEGRFFKGYSPSYTLQEWEKETAQVQQRIAILKDKKQFVPVFITVGALVANKNQLLILEACRMLLERGFSFYLYIVGDGHLMKIYRQFIEKNNLHAHITLTGKKTYTELRELYRKADFIIQAPLAEGYGKVPIEGFFHGVIPLLSDLAIAKDMTGNKERGFIFSACDALNLAELIIKVMANPEILPLMIENGRHYAKALTIENWANNYYETINQYFE